MHAVQITELGPPENLVLGDVPEPSPGPGQVRIRLSASSVNRADVLLRSGRYHSPPALPTVPGTEGAGVVDLLGPGVSGFSVGDRVVAWGSAGFYAEAAVADESRTVSVPDEVELQTAAALPVAWLTARYCLNELARVSAGDTVLVHAAGSGVGTAAVQTAAAAGAIVIGVAGGGEKAGLVQELGATHYIDRHAGDVNDEVGRLTAGRGVDVVLDLVGGRTFAQSLRIAAPGGRVVAAANVAQQPSTVDTRDFYPKNVSISGFQFTNRQSLGWDPRPDLSLLLAQLAEGRYVVPVDSRFELGDAAAAHHRLESGGTLGKVVLVQ
jgi:NADPH:quinone reductase